MAFSKPHNVTEMMTTRMTMRLPPDIHLDTPLAGSVISLPPECRIHHKTFVPVDLDGLQACHVVELARRDVYSRRKSPALNGLLGTVHVSKEGIALHVFAVSGEGYDVDVLQELENLEYAGLHTAYDISFATQHMYPCSHSCSLSISPCHRCLGLEDDVHMATQNQPPPHRTSVLLPRSPIRVPLSLFIAALRTALLVEIIVASYGVGKTRLLPFRSGFLYETFDHSTLPTRSRIADCFRHCHLHLDISSQHIYLRPLIRPESRYFHLQHGPSSLVTINEPGKSVILLPKGTPAYFLADYIGPTAILEEDFKSCLGELIPETSESTLDQGGFIFVWVEITDESPRGLTCIWPRSFCMASTKLPDRPASTLPELPAELRPYARSPARPEHELGTGTSLHPIASRRISRKPRPTKHAALQSHRQNSINISPFGLASTASTVNSYIGALVKYRDAERERLKRERDMATGAKKDTSSAKEAPAQTHKESPPMKVELNTPPPAPPPFSDQMNSLAIDTQHTDSVLPMVQSTSPPVAEDASLFSDDDDASPAQPLSHPDPLVNLDMSWPPDPASNGDFLPMSSEVDFGLGNADSLSHLGMSNIQFPIHSSGHNASTNQHMMNLDFSSNLGAFTDADFSFFDAPGTSTAFLPMQPPPPIAELFMPATGLTPSAGPVPFGLSPPTFLDHQQTSDPGSTPWTGHPLSPSLIPSGAVMSIDDAASKALAAPAAPASIPPSVASSPVVKLCADTASPSASSTLVMFEAIPFAISHLNVDDKYTTGKFAVARDTRSTPHVPALTGWREVYNSATDPHVGITKKIAQLRIGASSKSAVGNARTAQWVKDHDYEAWEPLATGADVDEEMPSPDDSDDETLTSAGVPSFPPGSLPPGSLLLAAQFLPGLLLPLTVPAPQSGSAAPSPAGMPGATPAGVPTPLSPDTLQGAETEKLRNLEAAAQILASEFVSNHQWMEAWVAALDKPKCMFALDAREVSAVDDALRGCCSLQSPISLRSVVDENEYSREDDAMSSGLLDLVETPSIYVGQSAAILKVQPTAVKFWEKLGLHPRGGPKHVTSIAFFDHRSIPMEAANAWLAGVTAAYEARRFGQHSRRHAAEGSEHGLVPIRFDFFRKDIDEFLRIIPPAGESLLFYVIVPSSIASLHSQHLRQVLGVMKRANRTGVPILFHLVPEVQVLRCGINGLHDTLRSVLTITACDVYDRLPVVAERRPPRATTGGIPQLLLSAPRFLAPAYSLARREPLTFKFTPNSTWIDAVDRWTLLHVGYAVTSDGRWTIVTCVDELGEANNVSIWMTQPENGYAHLVARVWSFVYEWAQKADIEWRIIIQKRGCMEAEELEAWASLLHLAMTDIRPINVSVCAIDTSFNWTLLSPHGPPDAGGPSRTPSRHFSDSHIPYWNDLSTVSSVIPVKPLPLTSFGSIEDGEDLTVGDAFRGVGGGSAGLLPLSSYLLLHAHSGASYVHTMTVNFLYTIRSASSTFNRSTQSHHADVMRSLNDLTSLHATRHPADSQQYQLPFHLSGLEIVERALRSPQ